MNWESKEILITIKTYPRTSKKYVETVCTGGVSIKEKRFLRIYPIPFRDLDQNKQYKKYNIISANVCKSQDDRRPESYKVDTDTIKIIDWLDSNDKWLKRKQIVLPLVDKSMCYVLNEQETKDKSLGLIKPERIDFYSCKAKTEDESDKKMCYAQLGFFNKSKNEIESVPYEFRYKFFCSGESACPGHDYMIIDWEIGQAYRDWSKLYHTEKMLLDKIREKWLTQICASKNDIHFYVGNTKRFRENFMVLGAFYPPK